MEDGDQLDAGTWPGGMDPYPDEDALSYPDEADESRPMPVPRGFDGPGGFDDAPGSDDPASAGLPASAIASDRGGRAARRQRVPTREVFCELADLASIPRTAYALETETDGAMCLLPTPDGFEVFIAADGARHEVRSFAEEEAAYFYLFGVLAAEGIRSGALSPTVAMANPLSGLA